MTTGDLGHTQVCRHCKRHFESHLGSLNRGELITGNVRLCKGHLSWGCRESSSPWQSHGEGLLMSGPVSLQAEIVIPACVILGQEADPMEILCIQGTLQTVGRLRGAGAKGI